MMGFVRICFTNKTPPNEQQENALAYNVYTYIHLHVQNICNCSLHLAAVALLLGTLLYHSSVWLVMVVVLVMAVLAGGCCVVAMEVVMQKSNGKKQEY